MSSRRDTILSGALGAALVLAAGSILAGRTAPASLPASAPAPSEARIACVDTLTVLQALWEQPELDTERRALAERLTAVIQAKQDEVQRSQANLDQVATSSQTRYAALPEGDPEREQIVAAYQTAAQFHQQLADGLEQIKAESQAEFDKQRAVQVRARYDRLKTAMRALADEQGYTHVLSSASNQAQFTQYSFDGVIQGVRDRPVLLAPEGTDLTDALLARLGVSRPTFGATPTDPMSTDVIAPQPVPAPGQ